MKILVPVKRVIDYNVKVRVKPDNSGVELANVKMAMNPFDEIAVEQALRIKEASQAEEVVAISIGPQQSQDTIRTALAMGADRGILVKTEQDIEPLSVAKILKAIVEKEKPELTTVDEFIQQLYGVQGQINDYMKVGQEVFPRAGGIKPRRYAYRHDTSEFLQ